MEETLEDQVQRLATYILENCEGYPNADEGAIDCAIRILKSYASPSQESVSDEEIEQQYPNRFEASEDDCKKNRHNFCRRQGAKWMRDKAKGNAEEVETKDKLLRVHEKLSVLQNIILVEDSKVEIRKRWGKWLKNNPTPPLKQ